MHYILEKIRINLPKLMIFYMCKASTKTNASLPYGMVIIVFHIKFKIPISTEEPKKPLRHTDIYNIQTLQRMGYNKVSGQWKRKENKQKTTDDGEPSRPIPEASLESPTRSTSLVPDQPMQPSPSSSIQLNEDQMRRIASLVADELRGHILHEQSTIAQFFESLKDEFARLSNKLHTYDHNQSSMQLYLL